MNKIIIAVSLILCSNLAHARFTQSDTWPGQQIQPATLNKYTYTYNDPVNLIDPSGNIAMLGGMGISVNIRGVQTSVGAGSYQVTLRNFGTKFACIAIEEVVTGMIMQQLTGGVYIADDGGLPYVGKSKDFERRQREHARNETRKIKGILTRFHMNTVDNNQLRVVEEFFMELYDKANGRRTNTNRAIAKKPRSRNSQALRKMVDKLGFCK